MRGRCIRDFGHTARDKFSDFTDDNSYLFCNLNLFKHLLIYPNMKKEELILSLKKRGFSKKIIDAFKEVPRENFVLEKLKPRAYEDTALPIGQSQAISQPYTIATMLSLLRAKKGQKVLEIGSGCGYVLALLSNVVGKSGEVFGVEIIKELAERSAKNLKKYDNVGVFNQNGANGLEEEKPYNKIFINAGI